MAMCEQKRKETRLSAAISRSYRHPNIDLAPETRLKHRWSTLGISDPSPVFASRDMIVSVFIVKTLKRHISMRGVISITSSCD
jgi:hypothetical protein